MQTCPHHSRHELQLKNLEVAVKDLQQNQRDPRIWVALFSFLGTCMATVGSFVGYVTVAYLKSKGWL